MLNLGTIKNWSLDRCNEELVAAGHYSLHNDVTEAREAVVAMAAELGVGEVSVVRKEIRIFAGFGLFFVQAKDNNGEWVSAESDGCSFATRDSAQECIDQWLRVDSDMRQVEDLVWFV